MTESPLNRPSNIIAFAIEREKEAAAGYRQLAGIAATPGLRTLALALEGEEMHHRELLENLGPGAALEPTLNPVVDLGLSDLQPEETISPDMSFQDLLLFAAKKEKKAAALYAGLARAAASRPLRDLFEFLADQERVHKLKIESEYERHVLNEN